MNHARKWCASPFGWSKRGTNFEMRDHKSDGHRWASLPSTEVEGQIVEIRRTLDGLRVLGTCGDVEIVGNWPSPGTCWITKETSKSESATNTRDCLGRCLPKHWAASVRARKAPRDALCRSLDQWSMTNARQRTRTRLTIRGQFWLVLFYYSISIDINRH